MVSDIDLISQDGINLKAQESLEKIILSVNSLKEPIWFSKRYSNENQLKELMFAPGQKGERLIAVEKVWLDPRNIMSPITIENVLGIHFDLPAWHEETLPMKFEMDAYLKRIRPMEIETLSLSYWCSKYHVLTWKKNWYFEWILNFRNLKKLTIHHVIMDCDISYFFDVLMKIGLKMIQFAACLFKNDCLKQFPPGLKLIIKGHSTFEFHITSLLENLNSLGEMKAKKTLEIEDVDIKIADHDLDEEKTEEIFKKAQEIIDEKFDELNLTERKHHFRIEKEKGKLAVNNIDFI